MHYKEKITSTIIKRPLVSAIIISILAIALLVLLSKAYCAAMNKIPTEMDTVNIEYLEDAGGSFTLPQAMDDRVQFEPLEKNMLLAGFSNST